MISMPLPLVLASASRYSRCPRCPRSAPSSREGAKFLGKPGVSSARVQREDISRSTRRYLLPTWAVLSFLPGTRYQSYIFIVGVPHLSLASSLLSPLPAIVSYTSGSYVVVELSRSFSTPSHYLRGTDFIPSRPKDCPAKRIPECWRTLRLERLQVGTESRDRVFSLPSRPDGNESL